MQSLSEDERKDILQATREALVEAVVYGRLPQTFPNTGVFQRRCGVFVSLHINGKLRGCIGMIHPEEQLGESIAKAAAGAALEDPRFSSVEPSELEKIEIEVSLLSEMQLTEPEGIEIGRDGLLVEHGLRRGLLLPQVAVEHHLDRERFLEETCYKAGLPHDAWKDSGTKIFRFGCEVICENKLQ
jgi:AmmeMemoRadiSam system protein A